MSTESACSVRATVERLNVIPPLKSCRQKPDPQPALLYGNHITRYVEIGRSLNRDRTAGHWHAEKADSSKIFRPDDAIEFAAGFFAPLVRAESMRIET